MSKVIGVTVGTTLSASSVANALKGKVSGSAVAMTDVSPLEHNIGVKLASKNLLDLSKFTSGTQWNGTESVPTCSIDYASGIVTAKSNNFAFCSIVNTNYLCEFFLNHQGKTFTFYHENWKSDARASVVIRGSRTGGSSVFESQYDYAGKGYHTFTLPTDFTAITSVEIRFNQKTAGYVDNTTTFSEFQLELGETATAYTPFVDLDSVTLKTFGENLWDEEWRNGTYNATTGAFEARNDIVANANPIMVKEGEVYAVNVGNINVFGYLADGTLKYPNTSSKGNYSTITITSGIKYINFRFGSAYGNAYKNDICVRKENAERNALYVPYEGKTYNGTVESVTSIYPSTTIVTDTAGVTIEAEYNRDINKAFAELLAKIGG